MSNVNVPNTIRYMYPATVEAVGRGVITAGGKNLRTIGNIQCRVGDRIWTDGRVVYGHVPVRDRVCPPAVPGGVPFVDRPSARENFTQGYYSDTAKRKIKRLGTASEGGFLVNNEGRLYLERSPGRKVLDAEILTDEDGVVIGYIMATAQAGVDISNTGNGLIFIQDSLGAHSEIINLENRELADMMAEDFAHEANANEYRYNKTNYIIQFLHFRFTNTKGDWEMEVGVNIRGLEFHREFQGAVGYPLFTNVWTLQRNIMSRSFFVAGTDLVKCLETVTISSVQSGEAEPGGFLSTWESASKAFAVIRCESSGRSTVIHRNYTKSETSLYSTTSWNPITTEHDPSGPWEGPVNAQPEGVIDTDSDSFLSRTGSYTYEVNYAVPTGVEDITGYPQIGLPGDRIGVTFSTSYEGNSTTMTFPRIREYNDVPLNLPDGYIATIKVSSDNIYGGISVEHEGTTILSNYTGYRGWQRNDYGLVNYDNTSRLWIPPKLSCYQFPQSSKALVSHYGERLMLCDSGNYTSQGVSALNLRLRRMRKIRKATQNQ